MTEDRKVVAEQVAAVDPLDEIERDCQARVLDWVAADPYIYRLQKPDVPKKHLVAYFAAYDPDTAHMLLVHHKLANAWLPTGGHVDPQEDPRQTVLRECQEELGVAATFTDPHPLFITEAEVRDGDYVHTDVSLWYVIKLVQNTPPTWERQSFNDVRWWAIRDILTTPAEQFGPDLLRFTRKLRHTLHQGF